MPALVLSDVMMPNPDVLGLVRAMREDPRTRTLPIMLLSARAGEESRAEGANVGADDYKFKPFSARELLARVCSQLARQSTRRRWDLKLFHSLLSVSMSVKLPLFRPDTHSAKNKRESYA